MKLLALDQSSKITGFAIFEDGKLLEVGKFNLDGYELEERLVKLRNKIKDLICDNKISEVAIEDIQMQNNVINNVQTFKTLAEVMGVIVELVTEMEIPLTIVSSNTWKSTCKIPKAGRTEEKRAAQAFVQSTFNKKVTQDEADATCLGYHYSQKNSGFDWAE